jgi:hypothetical protein
MRRLLIPLALLTSCATTAAVKKQDAAWLVVEVFESGSGNPLPASTRRSSACHSKRARGAESANPARP